MKDETIKKIIADRLKEARSSMGTKQVVLADMLDKSVAAYSQQENGRTPIPADDLFACSIMLGVPIQDLFPDPGEVPQAFRLIYEQRQREQKEKRKKELLAELERIEKELEE